VFAILVAACSAGSHRSVATPASTTTAARSTTLQKASTTTLASAFAACKATQLSISLGSDGAALGHVPQDFMLRNGSATTCTLQGAVRVRQYDARASLERGGSEEGSAYTFPAVPARRVVLDSGAYASFATQVTDNPAGAASYAVQCSTPTRTEFVMPNGGGVLLSPKVLGGCDYGAVTVSNIVAGRVPPRY
jgi:hypothetical protein